MQGNALSGALHITRCNSVWLECLLWEQDAAGSSPVTSTISSIHKGFDFMNTRFLFFILIFMYRADFVSALFYYANFGFVRYSIETSCRISAV